MSWCRIILLGLPLVSACSNFGGGVARVVDGQVHEGPFISPESYAAYARGAQLEALERYPEAEQAYTEALELDPTSAGIWTRVGAVRCARGHETADAAFEHAAGLEPEYAALWYERGRCSLKREKFGEANRSALRALSLDPLHLPTTTLVVETFVRLKQPRDALRYLNAAIALHPNLEALSHWKRAIVRDGSSPAAAAPGATPPPGLDALDRALLSDSADEARELALELDLAASEVAARAVLLGKTRAGLEQANLVLRADPSDGTAWVTVLSSADLLREEVVYGEALNALDEEPTPPGPLGVVLFADLLKRRVGEDAARAWLKAALTQERNNPLWSRELRRLERELKDSSSDAVTAPPPTPTP